VVITRSSGVAIHGFVIGGGYNGCTNELDDLVMDAAQKIEEFTKRDIEIRFNSDRRSGGAWVVDSLPGFQGNCHLGIAAGLYPSLKTVDNSPSIIRLHIYVNTTVLRGGLQATRFYRRTVKEGPGDDNEHLWLEIDGSNRVEKAVDWIKRWVKISKIPK